MSYQKLEIKKPKKEVLKLAKVREKITKDLGNARCINHKKGKVLVEATKIKEMLVATLLLQAL